MAGTARQRPDEEAPCRSTCPSRTCRSASSWCWALSAAVGFISGMFGVGGGFLLTPLLIFIGVPAAISVATVSAQITASSLTGALAYWRRRALDVKLGSVLLAGGLIGTLLGVWFFNAMRRLGPTRAGDRAVLHHPARQRRRPDAGREPEGDVVGAPRRGAAAQARSAPSLVFRTAPADPLPRSKLYISVIPRRPVHHDRLPGCRAGHRRRLPDGAGAAYLFRVPTAVVVGTSLYQILFTMVAATVLHAVTNQAVDVILALLLVLAGCSVRSSVPGGTQRQERVFSAPARADRAGGGRALRDRGRRAAGRPLLPRRDGAALMAARVTALRLLAALTAGPRRAGRGRQRTGGIADRFPVKPSRPHHADLHGRRTGDLRRHHPGPQQHVAAGPL